MKKRKKVTYENITESDIEKAIREMYVNKKPTRRDFTLHIYSEAAFKLFDDALKDAFRRHIQDGKSK